MIYSSRLGACIYFSKSATASFDEAASTCKSMKASLLKITSVTEQNNVVAFLNNGKIFFYYVYNTLLSKYSICSCRLDFPSHGCL